MKAEIIPHPNMSSRPQRREAWTIFRLLESLAEHDPFGALDHCRRLRYDHLLTDREYELIMANLDMARLRFEESRARRRRWL